ncbi:hypothetical protein [Bifidobacterium animalis]|uniref:hypothetical protein n=1 Tax=Bifidobacterium animalis TaxID=28025 RepID=UPI001FF07671|nr:hypothetical protein [Bifidobacterium animalis]
MPTVLRCHSPRRERRSQGGALPEVVLTSYIADDMLATTSCSVPPRRRLHISCRDREAGRRILGGPAAIVNGKIYNTLAICHAGESWAWFPRPTFPPMALI